jgi:hypothetical protein
MAVTLNERAFERAKKLIAEGKCVLDERDLWSEHQPTTEQENRFIAEHGFGKYSKWYLGLVDHSPCLKAGDSWAEHCEPDRGTLP